MPAWCRMPRVRRRRRRGGRGRSCGGGGAWGAAGAGGEEEEEQEEDISRIDAARAAAEMMTVKTKTSCQNDKERAHCVHTVVI